MKYTGIGVDEFHATHLSRAFVQVCLGAITLRSDFFVESKFLALALGSERLYIRAHSSGTQSSVDHDQRHPVEINDDHGPDSRGLFERLMSAKRSGATSMNDAIKGPETPALLSLHASTFEVKPLQSFIHSAEWIGPSVSKFRSETRSARVVFPASEVCA